METEDTDVSEMMKHLPETKTEVREDRERDECENCDLPESERRTERQTVELGSPGPNSPKRVGGSKATDFLTVEGCLECGRTYGIPDE